MQVAYLTDVEGSWNKLRTFVDLTPGVSFQTDDTGTERIIVDDGTAFVFGGDAVDRGPWSRRVLQALLDVKDRYPDRVVLLAGNRDINKLRLPRELQGAVPKKATPEIAALAKDKKPELLRWIFANTMGAAPAFEHRRTELRANTQPAGDDDVVRSILTDVLPPGGLHFRYLQRCQLAFRLGKTLYVHGGVAIESLGKVPGEPESDDVDGWIFSLNNFYREQVALFGEQPIIIDAEPRWLPLILYQAPIKGLGRNPASVVYGRFGSDAWNNPRLPSRETLAWLQQRGVARVVVGHTPCGDLPAILRGGDVEIVCADNSRGRLDVGNSLLIDDDRILLDARTTLDDGSERRVHFALGLDEPTDIGRVTADGHLIKGFVDDDRVLLFRFDEGFVMRQPEVRRSDLGVLRPPVDDPPAPPLPAPPVSA
ncbi:MAG: metallophosphoesterase [Deltaproteobacteria bacterium]|nr:metallophosphoesterase [Deltaproteobacteria bacterium]